MPLKKGTSQKTIGKNIKELMKGDQYEATKKKFGVTKARKQAIAAALNQARESGAKIPKK